MKVLLYNTHIPEIFSCLSLYLYMFVSLILKDLAWSIQYRVAEGELLP